ncbi:MAG: hypothetical protein R3F30_00830 [Planctomycetota bacterium]
MTRLLLPLLLLLSSCSVLIEYSDRLVDDASGRTAVVTKPASLGGIIGFVAGVPLDIVALPVTYTIYAVQKDEEEEQLDPLSTLLFPSFVLWRTGVLVIGAPLDGLEWCFYRAWARPVADRDREPEPLTGEGAVEQKQ